MSDAETAALSNKLSAVKRGMMRNKRESESRVVAPAMVASTQTEASLLFGAPAGAAAPPAERVVELEETVRMKEEETKQLYLLMKKWGGEEPHTTHDLQIQLGSLMQDHKAALAKKNDEIETLTDALAMKDLELEEVYELMNEEAKENQKEGKKLSPVAMQSALYQVQGLLKGGGLSNFRLAESFIHADPDAARTRCTGEWDGREAVYRECFERYIIDTANSKESSRVSSADLRQMAVNLATKLGLTISLRELDIAIEEEAESMEMNKTGHDFEGFCTWFESKLYRRFAPAAGAGGGEAVPPGQ